MKRGTILVCLLVAFAAGVGVSTLAKKAKVAVTPAAWEGKSPADAAEALLVLGKRFASDGSWENIHLARVYYLAGRKDEAEAIFNRYTTGPKVVASDLIRIARVYFQAGDWDKARPLYDRVLEMNPGDADWLIEAGASYNLNGNREHAEALFARGFKEGPRSLRNTLAAAGSYLGVEPRHR